MECHRCRSDAACVELMLIEMRLQHGEGEGRGGAGQQQGEAGAPGSAPASRPASRLDSASMQAVHAV